MKSEGGRVENRVKARGTRGRKGNYEEVRETGWRIG